MIVPSRRRAPGRARGGVRRRRRAGVDRRPRPLDRTGFGVALLGALRFAWRAASARSCSPSCAARSRACPPPGRLPRGPAARARRRRPRRRAAAVASSRAGGVPGARPARGRGRPRRAGRARARHGARVAIARGEVRAGRPRGSTCRRPGPCSRRWRTSGRSGPVDREWRWRPSRGSPCAPGRRRSRAVSRCSTCAGRAHAGSGPRSCSGSRRGAFRARRPSGRVLDADAAEALGVSRPDAVEEEVERHLFTIACTRPWARLALARQAATDEGKPLEPSPSGPRSCACSATTLPGSFAAAGWPTSPTPLDDGAVRPRAPACARAGLRDDADWATAVAAATGWERSSFGPPRHPARLGVRDAELRAGLAGDRALLGHRAREVRRLLVDVVRRAGLDPRQIDFELDARTRGSIAHATLARFYAQLPAEVGVERLPG